jgi:hypothetical protein
MPFALPLRTSRTIVEVYGALFEGSRFCHPGAISFPIVETASTSYARASVTTSASSPSMTDRACLPDPPCDWLMVTV